jgi:hypothetical protein
VPGCARPRPHAHAEQTTGGSGRNGRRIPFGFELLHLTFGVLPGPVGADLEEPAVGRNRRRLLRRRRRRHGGWRCSGGSGRWRRLRTRFRRRGGNLRCGGLISDRVRHRLGFSRRSRRSLQTVILGVVGGQLGGLRHLGRWDQNRGLIEGIDRIARVATNAAAHRHAEQKDTDGHDDRRHEQKHQLLATQLDLPEVLFGHGCARC